MMMMIQRISPSYKQRKASAVRDFPQFTIKKETSEIGSAHVAAINVTKENSNGYEDSKCVGVACQDYHRPKEVESFDSIMKKAGFNVAGNGNVGNGKFPPAKREVPLFSESKVKPLSLEEGIKLMASQSKWRRSFGNCQRDPLLAKAVQQHRYSPAKKNLSNATNAVQQYRYSPAKKKKLSNATALRPRANALQQHRYSPAKKKLSNAAALRLRANALQQHRYSPAKKKLSNAAALRLRAYAHKPTQHSDERWSNQLGVIPVIQQNRIPKDLSPREKVHEVLRHFKLVFEELDRFKAAQRVESKTAKSRIDYETRTILKEMGMQVNCQKMIGPVPGIEVGDEFQYKAELNLIGLHFDIMGGIDYMKKGTMELATSIVSSEGNDYGDVFVNDVMIYCGEGGNVKSKDQKAIKDQKLVAGNLALANSVKEKTPVRVIRGERRLDHRGKDYVYDGLYMVDKYWQERGPQGNTMFKFELSRIAGQPSVDF